MSQKTAFIKAQIIGTSDDYNWAQSFVLENNPSTPTSQNLTLFGAISLSVDEAREAGVVGKDVLVKINEIFLQGRGKPLVILKNIFASLGEFSLENLDLVLALTSANVLYLASNSPGAILLKRDDSSVNFFAGLNSPEVKTASGYLSEGDILVLKTPLFSGEIGNDRLLETLASDSLTETVETFAPQIRGLEDSSQIAAIFLQFSLIEDNETEEVKETPVEAIPEAPVNPLPAPAAVPPVSGRPSFFTSFKEKFSRLRPVRKELYRPPMPALKEENNPKKRLLKITAAVILLLLTAAVAFGYDTRQKAKQEAQFKKAVSGLEAKISEGRALSDLNPNKAKSLLEDSRVQADNLAKTLKTGSPEAKEIAALMSKVNEGLNGVVKIYRVDPAVYFDLTIVKDKAVGSKMASYSKKFSILDNKNLSVYLFDPDKKSAEIVGGGKSITSAGLLTLYDNNAYVLIPDKGIVKIDIKAKQSKNIIDNSKWGEIKELVSFAGNLYLLDSKNNQIWKYVSTDSGFSDVKNYLTEDTVPDFTKALGMAIDGSVYVIKSDGVVQKFTQGRADNFTISGLDEGLGNDVLIFTNSDAKNLYFLDKANKRVVILDKNGKYLAQYVSAKIASASGLSVDESSKKVYLLSGSQISMFNLK